MIICVVLDEVLSFFGGPVFEGYFLMGFMVFMVTFMVPDPRSISFRRARSGARSACSADKPLGGGGVGSAHWYQLSSTALNDPVVIRLTVFPRPSGFCD